MRKRNQKDDLLFYRLRVDFNNHLNQDVLGFMWTRLSDELWNPIKTKVWISLRNENEET